MKKASRILGHTPQAFELARAIVKAAPTEASVLLIGESGTGKEVVARAVHQRSHRHTGPFIAVNCGAITESLAESEFFGHEKGSFTDASATTQGCFEQAHHGTLFLDEITEMPLPMQVQLLRILETGQYHRVGGTKQLKVNVRIIAATNRDPRQAVQEGRLRSDLLYRLAVFPIRMPTLRERKKDIMYFARRFVDELNRQENTQKTLAASSRKALEAHNWPGNIRELKNAITRAHILADDVIEIQPVTSQYLSNPPEIHDGHIKIPVGTSLLKAQQAIITATLDSCHGDKRQAALALGISPKTLYNRLAQYQNEADSKPHS
ncbi:sigma-54 dependent transcriptional regulator [Pusillimonas sp. MFBS29]|uniref:sigma-54 interaction domain-containing protein n=1 Tax=Pusillimonas sp. MFBS29 TaxID=2886690 RepID=UPI001D12EBEE|nr:sigma-54 dependent transcriptional regulator [Pusillimonas sp. MFBS29]MCC2595791.1 sigma-54 dependent transcriptional regulator [Pusillimonas sp. MFBS29]